MSTAPGNSRSDFLSDNLIAVKEVVPNNKITSLPKEVESEKVEKILEEQAKVLEDSKEELEELKNTNVQKDKQKLIETIEEKVTEVKTEKEPKTVVQESVQEIISVFKPQDVLICKDNLFLIVDELYAKVFDKNPNLKPTKEQTKQDLMLYVYAKCKNLNAIDNYKNCFSEVEFSLERANPLYVPYIVKLTAFVDGKFKTSYSKQVVKNLTDVLFVLSGDTAKLYKEVKGVYDFYAQNKIDV